MHSGTILRVWLLLRVRILHEKECAAETRAEPITPLLSEGKKPQKRSCEFLQPPIRVLRQADRCELYRPSRRSRRPTSPGRVHRSASSRIRSRYSAGNRRRVGLTTTSGAVRCPSSSAACPPVFGALSALIVLHLHALHYFQRGAGVSVTLAERAGLSSGCGERDAATQHLRNGITGRNAHLCRKPESLT